MIFLSESLTVNELMSLMKAVRDRVSSLKTLRQQVSVKERSYWKTSGETESITEPQYDVKAVDKKIMELENFLFRADSKIKSANARTKVDLEVNVESLLEPLQ